MHAVLINHQNHKKAEVKKKVHLHVNNLLLNEFRQNRKGTLFYRFLPVLFPGPIWSESYGPGIPARMNNPKRPASISEIIFSWVTVFWISFPEFGNNGKVPELQRYSVAKILKSVNYHIND